jgi:hypothetical protein
MSAGGFEDPQAEQAEHGHEREVAGMGGLAGCGEQGLELQAGEPEGRRLGGHGGATDVLGGRVLQHAVDDASPVEPGRDREAPRDGGGLEPADLLHPPDVQLQMRPPGGQRIQAALGAPGHRMSAFCSARAVVTATVTCRGRHSGQRCGVRRRPL